MEAIDEIVAEFRLPAGAHVLVASADGREVHRVVGYVGSRYLREAVEAQVAGGDFVPAGRHTNLRLGPVFVTHTHGAKHSARGGLLDSVGYIPAAGLHVDFCHNDKSTRAKNVQTAFSPRIETSFMVRAIQRKKLFY